MGVRTLARMVMRVLAQPGHAKKNKQTRIPFHKSKGEGGIKRFLGNVQIHGPLFKAGP